MKHAVPHQIAKLHRHIQKKMSQDAKFEEAILECWTDDDFDYDNPFVHAAAADLVLSKHLGISFYRLCGLDGYDAPDIIARSTQDHNGDLVIYKDDPDHKRIWLLSGASPKETWRVHGSIMAGDGKKDIWWKDATGGNEPAYHVPQSALDDVMLHRESQQ